MDGNITRRDFVVATMTAAGGMALGLAHPSLAHALAINPQPWGADAPSPHEFNAWLVIEPDDSVVIRYGRAEMGQGSFTALTICVAEELQCDWSKVRTEFASAHRNIVENNVYGDQSSNGSHSVRLGREKAQQVGASARARLVAAAARRWGVDASSCAAEGGKVIHQASGRRLRYGELAGDAARISLAQEPAIKSPEQYTLMGKPTRRLDVPLKINGTAQYGIDTRLPGMVYAAVSACPVFGGTLRSVDASAIKGGRGIVDVVQLPNAVAVVADRWWRAKEALAKLKPEWDLGPGATATSAQLARDYRDALNSGEVANARDDGDADAAIAGAAKVIEALYEVPYLAHARMEPSNATARLEGDRLDLWIGTQDVINTTKQAARAAGLKPEQVYVHNCFVGGGFGAGGGGAETDQVVAIAKAVGKPVKLVWTREETTRHDRYRPQAAIRFKAGLGPDGMPVGWNVRTALGSLFRSAGITLPKLEFQVVEGLVNNPYKIANQRIDAVIKNTHVPVWFWRSVGNSQNAFAIQSFIDEMAHGAGKDPYQFRRALLEGKPDWLGVLDLVAEKSDWGKPLPQGRARGIAIHECYGSICGEVAEVAVNPKGEVTVERVTIALDSGHMVNPLTVAEQMEGGMIFGLTAALHGDITIKDGAVVQGNFDTYPMVRLAQAPKTEVYFAMSGGAKWGGVGEPRTAPIAAAVTNAIFAATGKRIPSLPIRSEDLASGA